MTEAKEEHPATIELTCSLNQPGHPHTWKPVWKENGDYRCPKCKAHIKRSALPEIALKARTKWLETHTSEGKPRAPGAGVPRVDVVPVVVKPIVPPEVKPPLVFLDEQDVADLYGAPAETISMILNDPSLNISDERCKTQGSRLHRILQKYGYNLPAELMLLPFITGAAGDYGRIGKKLWDKRKAKKKEEKAGKLEKTEDVKAGLEITAPLESEPLKEIGDRAALKLKGGESIG